MLYQFLNFICTMRKQKDKITMVNNCTSAKIVLPKRSSFFYCLFFLCFRWSHRLVATADKFGAPPSSYYYLTLAWGMCYARAGCLWLWSRVRQRKRQLGPPDKATSSNGPYSSVCCAWLSDLMPCRTLDGAQRHYPPTRSAESPPSHWLELQVA